MPTSGSGAASGIASGPSTALPNATDLINFLIAAGLIASTPTDTEELLDFENAINASIEAFLHGTGRKTILRDSGDVAHTFDPPGHNHQSRRGGSYLGGGRLLQLDDGLLTFTSLTVEGTTYTRDEQFTLMPIEAAHQGGAWEWVEFIVPVFARRGQIVITGRWGIAATLPADLKRGLLAGGALQLLAQNASLLTSGGLKSLKLGQDTFDFGGKEFLSMQSERWERQFQHALDDHRLVRL